MQFREKLKLYKKTNQYLIIAISGVSLLFLFTTILFIVLDRQQQYSAQQDTYTYMNSALEDFSKLYNELENTKTSIIADSTSTLPFFLTAQENQLLAMQVPHPQYDSKGYPFRFSSKCYQLLWQLKNNITSNHNIGGIFIFSPVSEYFIGVYNNGNAFLSSNELPKIEESIGFDLNAQNLENPLIFSKNESSLIISFELDGGLMLFQLSNQALNETLFKSDTGPTYRYIASAIVTPQGQLFSAPSIKKWLTDLAPNKNYNEILSNFSPIFNNSNFTAMQYTTSFPSLRRIVLTAPTQSASIYNNQLMLPFLISTIAWLAVIIAICLAVILKLSRPLTHLTNKLPNLSQEKYNDDISKISGVVDSYTKQIDNDRLLIIQQRQQLANSFLLRMLLDPSFECSDEKIEELNLLNLTKQYAIISVTSEQDTMHDNNLNYQKQDYQNGGLLLIIQSRLKEYLASYQCAYMRNYHELITVISISKSNYPQLIKTITNCADVLANQFDCKFEMKLSDIFCTKSQLHRAYKSTHYQGKLISNSLNTQHSTISIKGLMKKETKLASLIYIENYAKANIIFKEIILELYEKQMNKLLLEQQLHSFMTRTFSMLMESNSKNVGLINTSYLYFIKEDIKNKNQLLELWQHTFEKLEAAKSMEKTEAFSEQFIPIYQYIQTHFRDSNLSLGIIAEKFGMSLPTLSREFQKNLNVGFLIYLHQLRLDAATYEITHSDVSIKEIAEHVGYTNSVAMTKAFKKYRQITPTALR